MADYIVLQCIDVISLAEMRLGTDTGRLTINELVPAGYEFNPIPRENGTGGRGIDILYK